MKTNCSEELQQVYFVCVCVCVRVHACIHLCSSGGHIVLPIGFSELACSVSGLYCTYYPVRVQAQKK